MKEETIWLCMAFKGQPPAIPWAKLSKCEDCKEEIYYDPHLTGTHPLLKDAVKVCIGCGGKRMGETKDKVVAVRYPHRENKHN